MKVVFSDENNAFEDFTSWASEDIKIFKKILSLIRDIKRNPYDGIGKPEELKHDFSGFWSRRIDKKHRLVYQISEDESTLMIAACKNHYDD